LSRTATGVVVLCLSMIESLRGTAGLFEAGLDAYSHLADGLTLGHEPAEGVVVTPALFRVT
jgi:rhodanese-related sulfurtransferase